MGVLLMLVAVIVAVVENGLLQAVLFAVVAFGVVLPLLAAILKPRCHAPKRPSLTSSSWRRRRASP